MSSTAEYVIAPRAPGVRPLDPPDYDGITFVYVFTQILTPWTQPPPNQNVTWVVANSAGFVAGMTVVAENAGYYEVVSADAQDRLTVMNFGTNYNVAPGTGILGGKITTTSLPGPPGNPGPPGAQGPQGPPGIQGPVGAPLNPKGTVANSGALPTTGNTTGDLWIAADTGHAWSWTGSAWADMGPFQGPTGATGPTGTPGLAATIAVGSTVTGSPGTPANVQNVGSSSAATFNFTIPQGVVGPAGATGATGPQGATGAAGAQGPAGNQGAQGPAGPQGPPGGASASTTLSATFTMPASGATATASVANAAAFGVGAVVYIQGLGYLSVTAVNTGTNQLTLQNLGYSTNAAQGSTAPSGTAVTGSGPAGPAGPTGPQGPAGATGSQGPIGATGATGSTGPQGPQGIQGVQGVAGQGYTWRGAWASPTAYNAYDTVSYQGSSYICILANTNQVPTNTTYWSLVAQMGATGATGPTGATGAAGPTGSQGPAGATGATGPTGLQGVNSFTTCQTFTVPPVGQTVQVTVANASWMVVGEFLWIDQAGGGVGQAGALQITAISGNVVTLLNPTPPATAPLADATQSGLLKQLSGNTTDFVDGTNNCQNLVAAIQPTIWSVRLRGFNAIGNPNFSVNQKSPGAGLNLGSGTGVIAPLDRWNLQKTAPTLQVSAKQNTGITLLPGTNFCLSPAHLDVQLTTAQSSLAAGDYLMISQSVEGSALRELSSDVHSFSLLVNCTSSITFGVALTSGTTPAYSLVTLCSFTTPNTPQLITLPNLPVWPSGGSFPIAPGQVGYGINITLACGSTYIAPALNTWQSGTFMGASGQSNFGALPLNTVFTVAFVQHEPGAACTTLIDKPFSQNLDECVRYFTKSYQYGDKPGSNTIVGSRAFMVGSNGAWAMGSVDFPKRMAKQPTMTIYAPDGTLNMVTPLGGANAAITSPNTSNTVGDTGMYAIGSPSAFPVNTPIQFQYTADTGW